MFKICLIPGDGIGQEVIPAARRLLEETGLPLEFVEAEAGWETFQRLGSSVPEVTLDTVKACDATLAGAFTSPSRKVEGHHGAIRYMRRQLDLFANLRPARSRPVKGSLPCHEIWLLGQRAVSMFSIQATTDYRSLSRTGHL